MAYLLTIETSNGYGCSCCRRTWTDEHEVDTLAYAAYLIHQAKTTGHNEFEEYTLRPCDELSESERETLADELKKLEDKKAAKDAAVARKKAFEEDVKRRQDRINTDKARLEKNRNLYNEHAIKDLEENIALQQSELEDLIAKGIS